MQFKKQSGKQTKGQCSNVRTEVQMDSATQVPTEIKSVNIVSGGAEKPENPNQVMTETSPD